MAKAHEKTTTELQLCSPYKVPGTLIFFQRLRNGRLIRKNDAEINADADYFDALADDITNQYVTTSKRLKVLDDLCATENQNKAQRLELGGLRSQLRILKTKSRAHAEMLSECEKASESSHSLSEMETKLAELTDTSSDDTHTASPPVPDLNAAAPENESENPVSQDAITKVAEVPFTVPKKTAHRLVQDAPA